MNDALLVRGLERVDDLAGDRQRLVERQRPLRDAIGERRTLDELEHQRLTSLHVLESVDGADVRMIEGRQRLRLTCEASHPLGIGGEGVRQDLEGDLAIQPRVAGAIHLAHAARAKQRQDLEGPETGPW